MRKRNRQEFDSAPGAGDELKSLLGRLGIRPTKNCACARRCKIMNEQGIPWCVDNLPTIVRWLRTEAKKRKLPFSETAAKVIIRLAIRRAARNLAKAVGAI